MEQWFNLNKQKTKIQVNGKRFTQEVRQKEGVKVRC
jgi:hypothetical protein